MRGNNHMFSILFGVNIFVFNWMRGNHPPQPLQSDAHGCLSDSVVSCLNEYLSCCDRH